MRMSSCPVDCTLLTSRVSSRQSAISYEANVWVCLDGKEEQEANDKVSLRKHGGNMLLRTRRCIS